MSRFWKKMNRGGLLAVVLVLGLLVGGQVQAYHYRPAMQEAQTTLDQALAVWNGLMTETVAKEKRTDAQLTQLALAARESLAPLFNVPLSTRTEPWNEWAYTAAGQTPEEKRLYEMEMMIIGCLEETLRTFFYGYEDWYYESDGNNVPDWNLPDGVYYLRRDMDGCTVEVPGALNRPKSWWRVDGAAYFGSYNATLYEVVRGGQVLIKGIGNLSAEFCLDGDTVYIESFAIQNTHITETGGLKDLPFPDQNATGGASSALAMNFLHKTSRLLGEVMAP